MKSLMILLTAGVLLFSCENLFTTSMVEWGKTDLSDMDDEAFDAYLDDLTNNPDASEAELEAAITRLEENMITEEQVAENPALEEAYVEQKTQVSTLLLKQAGVDDLLETAISGEPEAALEEITGNPEKLEQLTEASAHLVDAYEVGGADSLGATELALGGAGLISSVQDKYQDNPDVDVANVIENIDTITYEESGLTQDEYDSLKTADSMIDDAVEKLGDGDMANLISGFTGQTVAE